MTTLRKATLADLPLLLRMEAEYARDQRQLVERENPRTRPYMRRIAGDKSSIVQRETGKFFRKAIRARDSLVSIGEMNGKPIGFCVISITQLLPAIRQIGRMGRLDVFFVRQAYRGRGVSSMMYKHAREWFAARDVYHVGLEVANDNLVARAIYKKWGFFDFFVEMRAEIKSGNPSS